MSAVAGARPIVREIPPPAAPFAILPAHVLVQLALLVVALVVALRAGGAWTAANATGVLTPEERQLIVFAAFFNAGVGVVLAVAWAIECLAAGVRLVAASGDRARALARLAVATLPVAAFGLGHVLASPWVVALARQAAGALR